MRSKKVSGGFLMLIGTALPFYCRGMYGCVVFSVAPKVGQAVVYIVVFESTVEFE